MTNVSSGAMWTVLALAGLVLLGALIFWALVARRVNRRNLRAQRGALARLGRRPDGRPPGRCSCGHPQGIHSFPDGPCLRRQIAYGAGDGRPCGCEGWNP